MSDNNNKKEGFWASFNKARKESYNKVMAKSARTTATGCRKTAEGLRKTADKLDEAAVKLDNYADKKEANNG